MRNMTLPSGALLMVNPAPFEKSKALYQAILKEVKDIPFGKDMDIWAVIKNAFCGAFASKEIEAALWECMKRCTYNDLKIEPATFEPETARQDFVPVCMEVGKENILPFVKSLYAALMEISQMLPENPK